MSGREGTVGEAESVAYREVLHIFVVLVVWTLMVIQPKFPKTAIGKD